MGPYLLVARHEGPALDSAATLLRAGLDAFVPSRFTRAPALPVVVFVFPAHDEYVRFCGTHYSERRPEPDLPSDAETCRASLGITVRPARELAVDMSRGRTTLLHELAHSLEEDFPQAPLWFEECVASVYEWPDMPAPGEIHGKGNFRHDVLLAALRSPAARDAVRLESLFDMDDDDFLGRSAGLEGAARAAAHSLHEAEARETCRWLDATGKLWPFYREWQQRWGDDPTGEAAFARVVGVPPRVATTAWLAWATDPRNDDRSPGRLP